MFPQPVAEFDAEESEAPVASAAPEKIASKIRRQFPETWIWHLYDKLEFILIYQIFIMGL